MSLEDIRSEESSLERDWLIYMQVPPGSTPPAGWAWNDAWGPGVLWSDGFVGHPVDDPAVAAEIAQARRETGATRVWASSSGDDMEL